jgi:hypothetical protein
MGIAPLIRSNAEAHLDIIEAPARDARAHHCDFSNGVPTVFHAAVQDYDWRFNFQGHASAISDALFRRRTVKKATAEPRHAVARWVAGPIDWFGAWLSGAALALPVDLVER